VLEGQIACALTGGFLDRRRVAASNLYEQVQVRLIIGIAPRARAEHSDAETGAIAPHTEPSREFAGKPQIFRTHAA